MKLAKTLLLMFLVVSGRSLGNDEGSSTTTTPKPPPPPAPPVNARTPKSPFDLVKENSCRKECRDWTCNSPSAYDMQCHCDHICELYKDCCFGYDTSCNKTNISEDVMNELNHYSPYTKCVYPPRSSQSYLVVADCPDGEFREKCRVVEPDDQSKTDSGIPWTDGVVSFRNIYCATCHYSHDKNSVNWSKLKSWKLEEKGCDSTGKNCYKRLIEPAQADSTLHSTVVRRCPTHYGAKPIDSCPPEEEPNAPKVPSEIRDNCGKFQAPLAIKWNQPYYKDINCLICNVGSENITRPPNCYPSRAPIADDPSSRKVNSFKVLIDFERLKSTICTEWRLFDVEAGTCRDIVCSEDHVFNTGVCRKLVYVTLGFVDDLNATDVDLSRIKDTLDVGEWPRSYGLMDLALNMSENSTEDSELNAVLFSRHSAHFSRSEMSHALGKLQIFLLCQRDESHVKHYAISTHPDEVLGECSLKKEVLLDARDRGVSEAVANLSDDSFWSISGDEFRLRFSSYLCANWTMLTCPKVLYLKSDYKWKDGVPLLGRSLTLRSDQFEIVGNYVYICKAALLEKWSLFHGLDLDDEIQSVLTLIGSSFSLAGLAYTILTYALLPQLRTLPGKMLLNLCVCLFFAQLIFLTGLSKTSNHLLCSLVAIAEHYFWLVSFCWMNSLAWNAMRTFSAKGLADSSKEAKYLAYYCIYSWGVPVLIVGVCVVVDFCNCTGFYVGYGDDKICWITNQEALLYAFALPIGLVVVANTGLFSFTVFNIFKVTQIAKASKKDKDRQHFWLYVKLSSVMGLTWVFGFLASAVNSQPLWYVFIAFNTTQGVLIGAGFSLNRRILRMYSTEYSATSSMRSKGSSRMTDSSISQVKVQ